MSYTPASSNHRAEDSVIFIVGGDSAVELKEFVLCDLICSVVLVVSVVMNFEDLKEVNEDFIGDLSAIYHIWMSPSVKSLLKSPVGSNATVLSVILSESFINRDPSVRGQVPEDTVHELVNRDHSIVVSIERGEECLDVSIFQVKLEVLD